MGLDIVAYKNLKVVKNLDIDEYGFITDYCDMVKFGASMDWAEEHFPGRAEGLNSQLSYCWEDRYGFRAGSYSGYNIWRSMLAQFTEDFAVKNSFIELIDFADNEGVIGSIVSKKLAADFITYELKAEEFSRQFTNGDYWFSKY